MPSAPDIAGALIVWAESVIPEVASSFAYPKEEDPSVMPELAIDFRNVRTLRAAQQGHYSLKQFDAVLSFVVTPFPYEASSQLVWSMAERLINAQSQDRTLGMKLHGIPMQSGPIDCQLPGIITWPEGTQARGLTALVQITTQPT